MKITADTNVLVRAMIGDDEQQSALAQAELAAAELVAIALPSLCELVWVLSQGYKVASDEIADAVRRLTNAALMSKGRTVDPRALGRSTELRLIRSWVGRGLVDALPFGSSLGRASLRAAARIDESDLFGLVRAVREDPA